MTLTTNAQWTDCDTCGETLSVDPVPLDVPAQIWNAGASDEHAAYAAHRRTICHACGAIHVVTG